MNNQQKEKRLMQHNQNGNVLFYVLVPVYNVEKYITECIQSVLIQKYENWELILVDDGSPDRSGEICDEYAKKDTRITTIHKANGGLISARRTAIDYVLSISKGGYLLFLDSDDLFEKNAFAPLAKVIEETKSDLVIFKYRKFKDGMSLEPIGNQSITKTLVNDKRLLYKRVFADEEYNSLCRKAVNLKIVQKVDYSSFYHIQHGEDLLQSIPYFKDASSVCFFDAYLYQYRMNPASITHSLNYSTYSPDLTLRKIIWEFLKKEGVLNEEDFADYAETCKQRLKKELRLICSFSTSKVNKTKLFDKLRSDDYCQIVLSYTKPKDRMVRAFSKKRYWEVFFICDYYKVGSLIKRLLHLNK